jgi:hypothetical protein
MTPADRDVMRRLAQWIAGEAEELAVALAEVILEAERDWRAHGVQATHAVEDVRVTLAGLVDALGAGGAVPETAARGACRLAAWAADEGVPWVSVARAWSRGQRELLDRVLGWMSEQRFDDPAQATAEMRAITGYFQLFTDDVNAAMAASYHETAARIARGGGHRQSERVDDLLAGRSVREEDLPFDVKSDHLAAVAWGDRSTLAVRLLGRALECEVTIEPRRDRDWAWFHGRPDLRRDYPEVVRSLRPLPHTFLAVGSRASGRDGFAVSHRQACHAERVAVVSGAPVTLFSDVALEAFALGDEVLAQRFMARQLGTLAEDKPRVAALRQTLEAYFDAGNRATAAATALGIHERTVSYRIRTSEERLGRYLTGCQDELALALRLRRLFDSTAAGAPSEPAA